MQARQAGQQRRQRKRRSQPHRPGSPHKGKHRSAKHPVAKRRAARKAARLASLRALLHHGRHSFTLASLGLLMLVWSCATPRIGEAPDHSLALVATDFDALPGWDRDSLAEALPALQNTCAALRVARFFATGCFTLRCLPLWGPPGRCGWLRRFPGRRRCPACRACMNPP